ncbi:hypothetical protein MRX96_025236 [Rhipicephalus microplus]
MERHGISGASSLDRRDKRQATAAKGSSAAVFETVVRRRPLERVQPEDKAPVGSSPAVPRKHGRGFSSLSIPPRRIPFPFAADSRGFSPPPGKPGHRTGAAKKQEDATHLRLSPAARNNWVCGSDRQEKFSLVRAGAKVNRIRSLEAPGPKFMGEGGLGHRRAAGAAGARRPLGVPAAAGGVIIYPRLRVHSIMDGPRRGTGAHSNAGCGFSRLICSLRFGACAGQLLPQPQLRALTGGRGPAAPRLRPSSGVGPRWRLPHADFPAMSGAERLAPVLLFADSVPKHIGVAAVDSFTPFPRTPRAGDASTVVKLILNKPRLFLQNGYGKREAPDKLRRRPYSNKAKTKKRKKKESQQAWGAVPGESFPLRVFSGGRQRSLLSFRRVKSEQPAALFEEDGVEGRRDEHGAGKGLTLSGGAVSPHGFLTAFPVIACIRSGFACYLRRMKIVHAARVSCSGPDPTATQSILRGPSGQHRRQRNNTLDRAQERALSHRVSTVALTTSERARGWKRRSDLCGSGASDLELANWIIAPRSSLSLFSSCAAGIFAEATLNASKRSKAKERHGRLICTKIPRASPRKARGRVNK